MLEDHLLAIRQGISNGRFANEAAVSQGIVLRLLHALSWPTYDPQVVAPEYSLEGRRVDFALCHPRSKPRVFIEVKQIGQSEGADRQLFEYAFHAGIPLAVMTDGQEWHFYLPAGQGSYQERRVYKLDILERDVSESTERLKRYLSYEAVCGGRAIEAAREDYRNVAKVRESQQTLPEAWAALIEEPDELLVELLADKVESLCGYKPGSEVVAKFLAKQGERPSAPMKQAHSRRSSPGMIAKANASNESEKPYFVLHGRRYEGRSAVDVMIQVFEELQRRDSNFCRQFADLPKHGRKRRYLAEQKEELYSGRPDLAEKKSTKLSSGFWLGTNVSNQTKLRIIEMACDVAGVEFGQELRVDFG